MTTESLRHPPARSDHLPEPIERLTKGGATGPVSLECIVDGVGKMQSNLLETWDSYILQLSVPGVDPDGVTIQVVGRQVLVSGAYRLATYEEAASIWESITSGQFYEVFRLPGEVNGDVAQAEYDRGILTVTLPKVVSHDGPIDVHVLT